MDSSSASAPPPKESFVRRYKFVWPVLLTINLAVGAYLFLRAKNKNSSVEDGKVGELPASSPAESTTSMTVLADKMEVPVAEKITAPPPIVKLSEVISPDVWNGALKWMLEEKRKAKPANSLEKKKIDEQKALLKQYIFSKSIPSL
ncbi:hypothetical protein QJS04_geneDACA022440 [Acorus gramineus]|uniref:Uncharacterized protein n=1 Tax=Acorus gramineus TaxID=55184 RepID=A0AAV9AJS5_ACOGR|nr:hypothetical protein QJS04_geneDACA022440 [Acorus gramineus]